MLNNVHVLLCHKLLEAIYIVIVLLSIGYILWYIFIRRLMKFVGDILESTTGGSDSERLVFTWLQQFSSHLNETCYTWFLWRVNAGPCSPRVMPLFRNCFYTFIEKVSVWSYFHSFLKSSKLFSWFAFSPQTKSG